MDIRLALLGLVHGGLLAIGILLTVIDARTHRLPNRIVLPTLFLLLLAAVADAVVTTDAAALGRGLLGALVLGGFYAALRLLSRAGMGGGDVKLALVIGLVLAWHGWGPSSSARCPPSCSERSTRSCSSPRAGPIGGPASPSGRG